MIRSFAVFCLFVSSICCFLMDVDAICTYGLFGKNELTVIHRIEGTVNDDIVVFPIISIISLIFSLFLAFISNKVIYGIVSIFFLSFVIFLLNRMLTLFDYKEVITTSIMMCNNYLMLSWMVFQIAFFIFSLVYIFKK